MAHVVHLADFGDWDAIFAFLKDQALLGYLPFANFQFYRAGVTIVPQNPGPRAQIQVFAVFMSFHCSQKMWDILEIFGGWKDFFVEVLVIFGGSSFRS